MLHEGAHDIHLDGLIIEDLVGPRIHHVRPVEGDEQAAMRLQPELRSDGAKALDRPARGEDQPHAGALRGEQRLPRARGHNLLVVRERSVYVERDRLNGHMYVLSNGGFPQT